MTALDELDTAGFTIISGPVRQEDLSTLAAAYDRAIVNAHPDDIRVGSSTTRVSNLIHTAPEFHSICTHPPLLEACARILRHPFELSSMHCRTLHPHRPAQALHMDLAPDTLGWTLTGFIFMIDEFRNDNGATRFLPGSHLWPKLPWDAATDLKADYPGQVLACAPAGSMIVFNGSVWHGHTVNRTAAPRRSIQGACIRGAVGGNPG